MRTVKELVGLAVVGEQSGDRLGRIQDVLFEPRTGAIDGFLVHPGGLFHKAQLLPRAAVRALGEDALLVLPDRALEEVKAEPPIPGALAATTLEGRPVLDDQGTFLGKAIDWGVAQDTLTIVGMYYSEGVLASVFRKEPAVPFSSIKAIGEASIVIPIAAAATATEAAPASEPPQAVL